MRILIVDASVTTRDRLVETLATLPGVKHVQTAASVLEATRAIQSGWPDVVVLDLNLTRGDGPRALDALRAGTAPMVSIVLTSDPSPECRQACLAAGADFFFDKAWEFQAALDVVARLARGDSRPEALPACWTVFDLLASPAWLYDTDRHTFRAVNEAAINRYGYSRDEFLTMTVSQVQMSEAAPVFGRQRHRDKHGVMLHVDVEVAPVLHDGARLAVAVAYDISEWVFGQQALRTSEQRSREQLERANRIAESLALEVTTLREQLAAGSPRE